MTAAGQKPYVPMPAAACSESAAPGVQGEAGRLVQYEHCQKGPESTSELNPNSSMFTRIPATLGQKEGLQSTPFILRGSLSVGGQGWAHPSPLFREGRQGEDHFEMHPCGGRVCPMHASE